MTLSSRADLSKRCKISLYLRFLGVTIRVNLQEGIRFLSEEGLNLVAVLDCDALPEQTAQLIAESEIPFANYKRLVLIGHGGKRLWERLQARGMVTADPVDHFSILLTRQFIQDYLDNSPALRIYPDTQYVIPLQKLGEAARWSFPSPLGSGISPKYGVWFAYRAAFLIDADLPLVSEAPALSPCDSCKQKRCVSACPAGAIRRDAVDTKRCAHYRLQLQSPCTERCLARLACPFVPEHRYTASQLEYHYRQSLETLQAWYGQ